MTAKIITIVTVTKNCETTIENTLNSIESIKSDNIEYIVIDGLSTDKTLKIIRSKIRIVDKLISESDTGIYNAMNKGIKISKGEYIVFLNGDDMFKTENFGSLLKILETKKHDIICGRTQVISKANEEVILKPEPWKLLFFNSIPHPSSFVRRKIFKKYIFDENYTIASDYKFFLTLFLKGFKFVEYKKVIALHRMGGVSSNVHLSNEELKKIRKECLGFFIFFLNLAKFLYKNIFSIFYKP